MHTRRVAAVVTVLGTALLLAFCKSNTTAPEQGSLIISLDPASLSLAAGGSATVTVSVTRIGPFTGPVSVTVDGLPPAVTAPGFSIPGDQTSGTLTVAAADSVVAATATATVHAAGTGVRAAHTLALTITPEPPAGGFTLSASPDTLTVSQGSSDSVTVGINRTGGFGGAVTLSTSGTPAGVTASFSPASTTGDQSTLALSVDSTAAAGTDTLTITGSASGLSARTTRVVLTVAAAAPTGGFTLSVSPDTLSVAQAASDSVTVSITRTGGFSGTVALTASGTATGVSASFSPDSAAGDQSTLRLSVDSTATTGADTITITGSAGGMPDQTTTVVLTVKTLGTTGSVGLGILGRTPIRAARRSLDSARHNPHPPMLSGVTPRRSGRDQGFREERT